MTAKSKAVAKRPPPSTAVEAPLPSVLLAEVRDLIHEARQRTAQAVNAGLTLLYWQVGARVRREVLQEKRAEYGTEIVSALGRQLEGEFGRGFSRRNLFRMVRFAEVFPDPRIVSALLTQLESQFGGGFAEKDLRRVVQFAEVFPDHEIVASPIRQLTWTHRLGARFALAVIPAKAGIQSPVGAR